MQFCLSRNLPLQYTLLEPHTALERPLLAVAGFAGYGYYKYGKCGKKEELEQSPKAPEAPETDEKVFPEETKESDQV